MKAFPDATYAPVGVGVGDRGRIAQAVIQYIGVTNARATVLTLGNGGTRRCERSCSYEGCRLLTKPSASSPQEEPLSDIVRPTAAGDRLALAAPCTYRLAA